MAAALLAASLMPLIAQGAQQVTVDVHQQTPTIFVDGRAAPPFIGMSYQPDAERIAPLVEAGLGIFAFNVTADHHVYDLNADVWHEDGSYDYDAVFETLDMYLAQAPEARFLLRVYTSAPPWWCKAHPEELLEDDAGSTIIKQGVDPFGETPTFSAGSFASELWIRTAETNLTRLVETMESSPYAPHILGYHVAGGKTEEWFNFLTYSPDRLGDYSAPMGEAWRRWLRARYRTDRKLRKAWADPGVSLDAVDLPEPARRREAATTFRDPVQDVMLTDFYQFFQEVNVNVLRRLSAAVKAACGGRKLVGAFYGYLFALGPSAAESGHMAIASTLDIPTIDFFASPSCYTDRRAALGFTDFMSATESVKLHGKLWINENDVRTFVDLVTLRARFPEYVNAPGRLEWGYRVAGLSDDPKVTEEILKRQLAATLGRGCGKWWFDITGGAYCDDRLVEVIRRSLHIARTTFDRDRSSAAEVALVIDDRSMLALSFKHPLMATPASLLVQVGHIGTPFDVVLLDDLTRADLGRYKLLVFANTYWVDKDRRRAIRQVLRRNDVTALFLYAPGVFAPGRPGDRVSTAMKRLTGLRLVCDPTAAIDPALRLTKAGQERFGLEDDFEDGKLGFTVMPVWCRDSRAAALGWLSDGHVGLAAKDNVIFCATPLPGTALLRAIARESGVHLYARAGDAVYASQSFVGVHTGPAEGRLELVFPEATPVRDLWQETELGRIERLTLPEGPGRTYLFETDGVNSR